MRIPPERTLPRRTPGARAARTRSALLLAAALAPALVPAAARAQYDAPPPPAAWALVGVRVVQPGAQMMDSMTVVVRNGLVEAMGRSIEVPADARVLEGEDLVVYPGFVDAHGEVEMAWPEPRDVEDEDDVTSWSPPRSSSRFTPHRRVADHLAVTGADLEDHRRMGIVASMAHPDAGMAPGQPAVLVHRHTETPWGVVERDAPGLSMSLRTSSVYPTQLFGVTAYLRQAFADAERWEIMRNARPGSFVPPGWDPDYEALRRAARREVPVYFTADSDEDIRRALDLSEELGFELVIVGGREAWVHADELAALRVPVLVSLDFPEPDEWDPEADTVATELSPSAAREKEEIENARSNPARLRDAGVTFALTSGGGDAEFPEGLRTVVEYGLAPGEALAAMTTTPAQLLGIASVGRVAAGFPATFTVSAGSLLEEDSEIRYTFVEGRLTRGREGGAGGGGGEAPSADVSGSWSGTWSGGGMEAPLNFVFRQSADGSIRGDVEAVGQGEAPLTGRIEGRTVTLNIQPPDMSEPIVLTGTLSEDGNRITGGGSTPGGDLEFTVTRGGGWAAFLGGAR